MQGALRRRVLSSGLTGGQGLLRYLTYSATGGAYTLAAAGAAAGAGVVHLWDERRGTQPVARVATPSSTGRQALLWARTAHPCGMGMRCTPAPINS